tara:strand:+ start:39 stop:380 length:342 start_codon:yes stop_codon:yes gene_type:complete
MTLWFGILKDLSWINEDDYVCCSVARKKYLDLFAERHVVQEERRWDVLHYIKDLSCEDLQKLSVIKLNTSPGPIYRLTINTKIGTIEILLDGEKARRMHEIKEQWRECENELM